jgi:hypothetical protein
MKPPARVYLIPLLIGIVGMLAGAATYSAMRHLFGASKGGTGVIFIVPWMLATITGVNLAVKEGRKSMESNPRR